MIIVVLLLYIDETKKKEKKKKIRLAVETGIWHKPNKVPYNERKCQLCNTCVPFFTWMSIDHDLRKSLIDKYYWKHPNMIVYWFVKVWTWKYVMQVSNTCIYIYIHTRFWINNWNILLQLNLDKSLFSHVLHLIASFNCFISFIVHLYISYCILFVCACSWSIYLCNNGNLYYYSSSLKCIFVILTWLWQIYSFHFIFIFKFWYGLIICIHVYHLFISYNRYHTCFIHEVCIVCVCFIYMMYWARLPIFPK